LKKDFVTLSNGEKLSYHKQGEGKKTVILLSGLGAPMPLADMYSIFQELSKHCQTIVLNRFGYSYSDITKRDRTLATVVKEIKEFCDILGIKENVYLVGHSLGSFNALGFAEEYPKMVDGVVLLDCYPLPLRTTWYVLNIVFGYGVIVAKKLGILEKTSAFSSYIKILEKEKVPENIIAETIKLCAKNGYNNNVMEELKSSRNDVLTVTKNLKKISTLKVLSICRKVSSYYSKKIKRLIPEIIIHNVGVSSHMIHHDHEKIVIKDIVDFIK